MDQIYIGSFITRKRKEKNMTQLALAERLGVSNKTISKWETGKCMPDYGVIEPLCKELDITVAELLDGEERADNSVRVYDEAQVLELIKRMQALENQRTTLNGFILIIIGLALFLLHYHTDGKGIKNFISALLLGTSVADMSVGVYVVIKELAKQRQRQLDIM